MKPAQILTASLALCATLISVASAASVDAMRWHKRILLVASPGVQDPKAEHQHRILAKWEHQAADRDVSLVEVSGSQVLGATDEAESLRERYQLSPGVFEVLLIGKDGHVALRSADPVSAETLQATIDAMPMRKAGER